MKQYRCLPNKSDGIFSVSIPYRSPIILLSSSYCEAENNTEWSERRTNKVRWNKGGKFGSSDISSDKFSIEQKKTAEHFVYLNNHKQIYNNEQQFSISCMGALQP